MILDYYPGQKGRQGLYQKIINQIPQHSRYLELFAGSAAIYALQKIKPDSVILNDLNVEVRDALQRTFPEAEIISVCAISFLKSMQMEYGQETFIFLDPTYMQELWINSAGLYKFVLTDQQHIEMLEAVKGMRCRIMIQHPKCELYDTVLSDWRKVEVKVRYHKKTMVEILYMNYDQPTALQSYAHLGTDSWDRQRIKRKGDRFIKKLSALPVLERKYILERLKEFDN